MTITLDLSDETVWALLELSGTESLEEAMETAVAGYIRLERAARLQALSDALADDTGDEP